MLTLPYETILANPTAALIELARFFAPHDPVDLPKVGRIIHKRRIAARRTVRQFRHFDRGFAARIEGSLAPETEALAELRVHRASEKLRRAA